MPDITPWVREIQQRIDDGGVVAYQARSVPAALQGSYRATRTIEVGTAHDTITLPEGTTVHVGAYDIDVDDHPCEMSVETLQKLVDAEWLKTIDGSESISLPTPPSSQTESLTRRTLHAIRHRTRTWSVEDRIVYGWALANGVALQGLYLYLLALWLG